MILKKQNKTKHNDSFSVEYLLLLCQKSVDCIRVDLFLVSLFCFILCTSPHNTHCLDYCGYVINLKIKYSNSSYFILLFSNRLNCSNSLAFPHEFYNNLVLIYFLNCWGFDRNYIKSIGQFGEN